MNTEVIRLDEIRRDFRVGDETVHALRGVSFTIREGEFVTIMGTSGSGKSTLLNTLGCLDTPTSGEYYLDGVAVRTMDKNQRATLRNRKIGFVFQNFNLLPYATAWENIELPMLFNGKSGKKRKARTTELLKAVGLYDWRGHRPSELSGGQQQRIALARALANDPPILLADEPTGNLDSKSGEEIMAILTGLWKSGRTIIMVTHNDGIAARCERIIRIFDGRVLS